MNDPAPLRDATVGEDTEKLFVTVLPSSTTISVRPGETIVDALRRHGLRTRYKCRRGGCGVCRAKLVAGDVTYRTAVCPSVLEEGGADAATSHCLPCRAVPASDVVIELGPQDRLVDVLSCFARRDITSPKN